MGSHEPYWHTNTSFSPLPSRWDFRFQSEGLPYDGIQHRGSSTMYNEKDLRGSVRDNRLYELHHSASDGTETSLNSPSDFSRGPQRTPPVIQEISIDDYETATGKDSGRIFFTSTKEGMPENPDSWGSSSSRSESNESELFAKSHLLAQQNFSCHQSFISKPIHPLSFPDLTSTREAYDPAATGFSGVGASTSLVDSQQGSSASSSLDFADAAASFEFETPAHNNGFRCSLCERFLSQRSPWSSRRIVRSRDMPTTGVLPCSHVFHAECLEQTTPNLRKNDPPCPLCSRAVESCPGQRGPLSLKNGLPRIRPFYEDGPSRPCGCAQVGDCVEGALHAPPPRNTMFLLNRNRIKKNRSFKGNSSKEFLGQVKKSGSYSSLFFGGSSADQEAASCSNAKAGPS